jgi:hypothetical protein
MIVYSMPGRHFFGGGGTQQTQRRETSRAGNCHPHGGFAALPIQDLAMPSDQDDD